MPPGLDDHGQPLNARFNAARRATRTIHEMLGLVKGLIVDGVVTEDEARFLAHWINANPQAAEVWPGSALTKRLQRIFADGRIDAEEREDLLYFLQKMTGEDQYLREDLNRSTQLPWDDPLPSLEFVDRVYVFSGRFYHGTRTACQKEVEDRGGSCATGITKGTNVLVIGDLGSRDWAHTSFGRKIQKAVSYRDGGVPLAIVGEEHWVAHL